MLRPVPILFALAAACVFACSAHAAADADLNPYTRHAALDARLSSLSDRSQFAEFDRVADSALAASRASRDPGLERLVIEQQARALARQQRLDESWATAAKLVPLARAARDTLSWLSALRSQSFVLERRGEAEKALALNRRGAALARAARRPSDEGAFELRSGYACVIVARSLDARKHFRAAVRIAEGANREADLMRALSGLADTYFQAGEYPPARETYDRALELARKRNDQTQLAYLLLNNAEMEMSIGDPDLAPEFGRQAVTAARAANQSLFELKALRSLAQYEVARGAWERVDSMMTELIPRAERQPDRDALLGVLLSAARARIELGRIAEAEALEARAIALIDSVLPLNAAFHAQLVIYNRYSAGQPREALRLADVLIGRLERRIEPSTLWRLRMYRDQALIALGRGREALPTLRVAIARTAPRAGGDGHAEHFTALAFMSIAQRQAGRVDSALVYSRRAIARWERERSAASLEELLADNEDTGAELGFYYACALLDPRRHGDAATRTIEAFSELQRFRALAETERVLGPAQGAAARRSPFDFAAWRAQTLRPGELFLDFSTIEDSTLVIAVTRQEVRSWMLPGGAAIEKRLKRYSEMLAHSGAGDPSVRPTAEALGKLLFGPGADLVRGARSVLLCAGRLGEYPLGAVVSPGDAAPLSLEHTVSLVPSARLLAVARRRTGARPAAPHALVAVARTQDERGRRLPAAGEEVRSLGRSYDRALAVVDPPRSASQLAAGMLGSGGIVHVAAHARVDLRKPWQSELLLGDPARRDAWLPARSIGRLKLAAKLCVLASCRSLGGGGTSGQSLSGLAPAWIMAGVPAVVATQWDVDDRATGEFMRRFYGALAGGDAVGAALQRAQREMRATPEWSAPRFWAGFVVLGDPATRVSLVAKR